MTDILDNQIDVFQFLEEKKIRDEKEDINEGFNIGDIVEIEYGKEKYIGKIQSIYNNGHTINVTWNGKRSAFYHKKVKLIKKAKKLEK